MSNFLLFYLQYSIAPFATSWYVYTVIVLMCYYCFTAVRYKEGIPQGPGVGVSRLGENRLMTSSSPTLPTKVRMNDIKYNTMQTRMRMHTTHTHTMQRMHTHTHTHTHTNTHNATWLSIGLQFALTYITANLASVLLCMAYWYKQYIVYWIVSVQWYCDVLLL